VYIMTSECTVQSCVILKTTFSPGHPILDNGAPTFRLLARTPNLFLITVDFDNLSNIIVIVETKLGKVDIKICKKK
jgi:hypothetical protein